MYEGRGMMYPPYMHPPPYGYPNQYPFHPAMYQMVEEQKK
jgi:hypothetical protein